MRVLIGCERSGIVRRAFRGRGHDAYSCDIEPADDDQQYHLRGDAVACAYNRQWVWDLLIFFSPCTFTANSGSKHLYIGKRRFNPDGSENPREPKRWANMEAACDLWLKLWNAPILKKASEWPRIHGHAQRLIGVPVAQVIQPHQFGHGETKATCLRLDGLPPLLSTLQVEGREQRIWKMGPSPDRQRLRSQTFLGIGQAMADQWGIP